MKITQLLGRNMEELTIKISQDEVNMILLTLAKQPYEQVFVLIAKIREQANSQIKTSQGNDNKS